MDNLVTTLGAFVRIVSGENIVPRKGIETESTGWRTCAGGRQDDGYLLMLVSAL